MKKDRSLCLAEALAALVAATHVDAYGRQDDSALRQTRFCRLRSEPETHTSCLRQEPRQSNKSQTEHNQQAALTKHPASTINSLETHCYRH